MEGQALLLVLTVLYFVPAIVASLRGHRNALAIGMLTLLLGWTLLGWVGALVWACTDTGRATPLPRIVPPSHAASPAHSLAGHCCGHCGTRIPPESDICARCRRLRMPQPVIS
jgi:hypothetical protein